MVVTDSADAATIAEIDAAARLSMDSAKTSALTQIAEREALAAPVPSPSRQRGVSEFEFRQQQDPCPEQDRCAPGFFAMPRHAIVSQLNKLSFDSNRQHILHLINERLKVVPAN